MSAEYLKYTDILSHLFLQDIKTIGYFLPHFSSNLSSLISASSLIKA
jgi:hypothetical protein